VPKPSTLLSAVTGPWVWFEKRNVCGALCRVPTCVQDPRDDVSGEKQVADDMLQFLQEFFEGKPGWAQGLHTLWT
jgi:hypothetical protein